MKSRSSPAARSPPTTSSRSPGRSTSMGARHDGDRLPRRAQRRARVDAAHARSGGRPSGRGCRLRPAAHADDGGASRRPRRHRPRRATTRGTGSRVRHRSPRTPRRSTSPGSRRSRSRSTGWPTHGLPIGVQLVASHGPRGRAPPRRRAARGGAAVGRPPPTGQRLSARRARRRWPGLLRRHPARRRGSARRGRRLPLPRGARRADARDPAEGPPARRDAGLHARPARVPGRGAARGRRGPHEGDHERGRHQPDRGGPCRRRDREGSWASPASRSRPCSATTSPAALDDARAARRRSRTSTPARRSTEFPGAAAVRLGVPRRAPDRRRARRRAPTS